MAFLDEEDVLKAPEAPGRFRRGPKQPRGSRTPRPPRPPAQALLMRRLIAVGIGLLFVILVVLAFRGCLNARKDRAINNFVTDSSRIMTESAQNGQQFFSLLSAPAGRSPLEYEAEIKSLRGSSETLYDRADDIEAPDEMNRAKSSILIALELRRNALGTIADNIGTALGKENAAEAQKTISEQMKLLVASDAVFQGASAPEIASVVDDSEVAAQLADIPNFVPDPPEKWLDPATITGVFTQVSPQSATVAAGLHGVAIVSSKIGDTDLTPGTPVSVSATDPTLVVTVENGGESEETGVQVTAAIGATEVNGTLPKIGAGQTSDVSIRIPPDALPASGEQATVNVTIEPVPGEENSDNNSATYTVTFQ